SSAASASCGSEDGVRMRLSQVPAPIRRVDRAALLLVCAMLAAAGGNTRRSGLEIRIDSPRASYINGEKIQVNVTVTNTGAEPVSLPALDDSLSPGPYFVLSGPSYPEPRRFHWLGRAPTDAPESLRTLAAGQSLAASL